MNVMSRWNVASKCCCVEGGVGGEGEFVKVSMLLCIALPPPSLSHCSLVLSSYLSATYTLAKMLHNGAIGILDVHLVPISAFDMVEDARLVHRVFARPTKFRKT